MRCRYHVLLPSPAKKKENNKNNMEKQKPKYTQIIHQSWTSGDRYLDHRRYCKAKVAKTPMTANPIPVVIFSAALVFVDDPPPWLPLLAVWLLPLTPEVGLLTFPVQTNPFPFTTPLFWISGKGHWKESEEDWTLTPPRTSLISGREALLNDPVQSMDPPTVETLSKPPMVWRSELFAMRKVPPIWVSWGKDVFVREEQLTKERELPTRVKFGAEMLVRVVVKKPKLLVTLLRLLKLMDWMFRKEALLTVSSSGRLTVSRGELAAMERAPLTSFKVGCSTDFKKRLLSNISEEKIMDCILMSKSPTEERESPVRAANWVSEIWTLPAWLIPSVIVANKGRITKLIPPTEVKEGALTVVNAVKLSNSKVPPMLCRLVAWTVTIPFVWPIRRSPVIFCMPAGMVTGSNETDWMRTLPVTVEQLARASRSLWLWISNPFVLLHEELALVCARQCQHHDLENSTQEKGR